MKKKNYALDTLVGLARAKFDWNIDPVQLGETFSEAAAVKDMPRLLVPLDRKEMEDFFLKLAKSLEPQIFKKV